jgi:hypothetical protein
MGVGDRAKGLRAAGHVEDPQAEERAHLGDVHHPGVVNEARDHRAQGSRGIGRHRRGSRRSRQDPANGARGDPPAGGGEGEGDRLLAAKAGAGHEIDRCTHGVGEPSDGRCGFHGRADGPGMRIGGALPVRDGVRVDEEDAGGELTRPSEEAPDLEGAEALGRRVVRAPLLRDLPEASGQELDDLPGEAGVELRLLDSGLHSGEGVVEVSKLAEVVPAARPRRRAVVRTALNARRSVASSTLPRGWQRMGGLRVSGPSPTAAGSGREVKCALLGGRA